MEDDLFFDADDAAVPTGNPAYGWEANTDEGNQLGAKDLNRASLGVYGNDSQSALGTVTSAVAGGVADLPDLISSSVGLTERGQINDNMLSAIGSPGLTQWYNQNKGAVEVGSGVASVIVAELAATRLLSAGGWAMKAITKVPFVGRVAKLDSQYQNAMRLAQVTQTSLARSGAIGTEQYVGTATIARLGMPGLKITSDVARRNVLRANVARGLVHNVAVEGILAGIANQNDFLYSEDMGENLLFMGGALGVGAAIDRRVASYALKKFANGDTMNRVFARTLDPGQTEAARLKLEIPDDRAPGMVSSLGYLKGSTTDAVTSYQLSTAELRNTDSIVAGSDKTRLATTRNRLADQQSQRIENLLQQVSTSGVRGVNGSAFSMSESGLGNALDYTLHHDPVALFGVEELGRIPKGLIGEEAGKLRQQGIDDRLITIQGQLKDNGVRVKSKDKAGVVTEKIRPFKPGEKEALLTDYKQTVFRNSLTEVHYLNGEIVPKSVGNLFDDFIEPTIKLESSSGDLKIWQTGGREAGRVVGVDNQLTMHMQGKKFDSLHLFDSIAMYRAGNQAVDHFTKSAEKMVLPKNPHWFQLDMAEELLRRGADESKVVFPGNLSREDAMVESFKQKAKAVGGSKALQDANSEAAHELRFKYNLPRLTSYEAGLMSTEENPAEILLRGMAGKDLDALSYPELISGIAQARQIRGFTDLAKDRGDQTLGNMFKFGLDDSNRPMERMVAYKRPFVPFEYLKDNLADRLALRKAYTRQTLMAPTAGELTRNLTTRVTSDPDFLVAGEVGGLQDIQIASQVEGFLTASPQSVRGSLMNDITPREFRDRDTPQLLAAGRIRDKVERYSRSVFAQKAEHYLGDVIARINGPRVTQSKLLANQYLTFRRGWDLKTKKVNGVDQVQFKDVTLPGGGAARSPILDEKSIGNQTRWKTTFGRGLTQGDSLTAPNGTVVVLDDLSEAFITRLDGLSTEIRKEKNTLNRAVGLGEIQKQPLYAPPPNTKGKFIGFTFNAEGKTVPNGAVIADTQEHFNKELAWLENPENKGSPLHKPGHTFRSKDDIENFQDIWDSALQDWIDPRLTAAQPGRRATGSLSGSSVDPSAVENALAWVRDSYLNHGHDIIKHIFRDQLNAVEQRAAFARDSRFNAKTGNREADRRSIYDYYRENLLGQSAISSPGSLWGTVTKPLEERINAALVGARPALHRVYGAAQDWVREKDFTNSTTSSNAAFKKLTDSLGPYMPMKSANEFAERQFGYKAPRELAQITGQLSQFEATMRLRMFEVMHPLMNLAGVVNAMPAVIRSMQPRAAENSDDFLRRIGHLGQSVNIGDKTLGIFSMPKLIYQTLKDTWSIKSHADFDHMVSHGYTTQEIAEIQRQFGVMDGHGDGWQKLSVGGKEIKYPTGKKLVDWVSTLSDKSEDFSRSWGHMAGLKLADHLGIVGTDARHGFAHDVANKMIANYDPKNRPAIFQGALGAPIGLFQSFIWQYYQRLFRYVETGDARAFATQYATQAALFGVTSLTGWNEINKMFFDSADGKNSPLDQIYDRFGPQTGDLLMGGVLSNLPKLANLLPGEQGVDGVNLYSRGDTSVRVPGLQGTSFPVIDTLSRAWKAVQDGITAFSSENPHLTGHQLADIASNMLTNRPFAGFVETFGSGGYDTDKAGAVAAESKGFMESTARVLGVRSIRQAKELEAYYANNNAMALQRAQMDDLRMSARAAIRAGDAESLPDYFDEYVKRGGDARRFSRWMKDVAESAVTSKAERQLDQFGKSPAKQALVQRLVDMGVSIDESEEADAGGNPYDGTDYTNLPTSNPDQEIPVEDSTDYMTNQE